LKEEALNSTMWRNRFGGGFGTVVRQNIEWIISVNLYNFLALQCRNTQHIKKESTCFKTDSSCM
jgi:hypothetical protein